MAAAGHQGLFRGRVPGESHAPRSRKTVYKFTAVQPCSRERLAHVPAFAFAAHGSGDFCRAHPFFTQGDDAGSVEGDGSAHDCDENRKAGSDSRHADRPTDGVLPVSRTSRSRQGPRTEGSTSGEKRGDSGRPRRATPTTTIALSPLSQRRRATRRQCRPRPSAKRLGGKSCSAQGGYERCGAEHQPEWR